MSTTVTAMSSRATERGNVAYFDDVAAQWHSRYQARHVGGHALRERRERAVELLKGTHGRLLDVGCGSGIMAEAVAPLPLDFYGVDAAPRMIKAGRDLLVGRGGFTACVAVAEALPFRDGAFDVATCLGVIGAVDDREKAVAEIGRVLRPGGTLLISFSNLASPYALWKGYVFYRLVNALAEPWAAVRRRPVKAHRGRHMSLFTPVSCAKLLGRHGMMVREVVYYDFNFLLAPLDEVFVKTAHGLAQRLSTLSAGRFRHLGAGFVAMAILES